MQQRSRSKARAMQGASAAADAPLLARRSRSALCATTALQAAALLVLHMPARAQPAPNARPAGGQVSSGAAAISGNATTTLIRQSSQNAVINWQSYNVGNAQIVQYAQPNAASFTLNRVISPNPSQIAGHILANGRIAIVNQSGVVFLQGSTVDTAGLVISAAGITDQDFMAGRLVFVQPPAPGAVVSNAGNITVRQAGLAALVAPQVANSGVITAVLGRVMLGGAATHTLDMYGDGLVALNVTGQVTQVQLGGRTVTALVTNTGTILAPGGTVVLTAQAADGVVSKLISAGGTISAPTLGGQSGRVLVSGVGGDIEVDGAVQATGASGVGGSVTVTSNRNVLVAQGAMVDASGASGGGGVSVAAPTGNATVASGAVLRARGTVRGRGGRIAVQAGGTAAVHGTLDASGATLLDAGGTLAISGSGLTVDGLLTANLPGQQEGEAIFGPSGPVRVAHSCANIMPACITFATFVGADKSTLSDTNGFIEFLDQAGQGQLVSTQNIVLSTKLTVPMSGTITGDIIFDSGTSLFAPNFAVNAAGSILIGGVLSGKPGQNGTPDQPATSATLTAAGDIVEHDPNAPGTAGAIETSSLIISAQGTQGVLLDSAANAITTAGGTAVNGSFTLTDLSGLSITTPVMAGGDVTVLVTSPGSLDVKNGITGTTVTLSAAAGITIDNNALVRATGDIGLATLEGNITLNGTLVGLPNSTTTLSATGGDIVEDGETGSLQTGTLLAYARMSGGVGGAVTLDNPQLNTVAMLAGGIATGDFTIGDSTTLAIAGTANISGANVKFDTASLTVSSDATISTQGNLVDTGNLIEGAALIRAAQLGTISGSLSQTGGVLSAGTLMIDGDVNQTGGELSVSGVATIGGSLSQSMSTLSAGTLSLITGATLVQSAGIIALGQGAGTISLSSNLSQDAASTISAEGGTLKLSAGGSQGLTLNGLVSDATGTVDLVATRGGVSQTGSAGLSAGTLVLQVGTLGATPYGVTLDDGAANHIVVLSTSSVSGNLTLADGAQPELTLIHGAAITVGGTLGLDIAALRMSDLGSISAASFSLTGNLFQQIGDSVITPSGLSSVGGALFQQGGTLSGGSVTIGTGLQQSAGGLLHSDGALTISGPVVQDASTISADGAVMISGASFQQSGSTLTAVTLSIQANTFSQGSDLQGVTSSIVGTSGATISADNNLVQDAGSSIAGGGTLSLTSARGTLSLAGLVADANTVSLGGATTQAITEASDGASNATGSIIAGVLNAQAAGGITLNTASGSGLGNAITLLGTVVAGGTLALADGVGATVTNLLSAGDAALRMPTLTVAPGAAINVARGGTLSIGADTISIIGTVGAAGGLVAIGLLHPGIFSVTTTGGTTDPTSLENILVGPTGTIALGTTDGFMANGLPGTITNWNAGTTGSVTSLSVLAALPLSVANAGTLGLFSNGGIDTGTPSNAITVTTLYGAADGHFLAGSTSNSINFIGSAGLAATAGSLVLGDAGALEILSNGEVSGSSGVTLTVGGPLTQDSSSSITSTAGNLMLVAPLLNQQVDAVASGLAVMISGGVSQAGTDMITASASDYTSGAVFQSDGSTIAALNGSAFVGGTLTQIGSALSAGTLVSVGDSVLQIASNISGGTVMLVTSGTGTLTQADSSSITAKSGQVSVSASSGITQDQDSSLTSLLGDITLSSTQNDLLVGGLVSALNGEVRLTAAQGRVTQNQSGSPIGTLLAGTLSAQAGMGDLLLNGPANQIGTISLATATGQLWLVDAISAAEATAGRIAAADVTLTLIGQTLAQDSLAVISSADTLAINATTLVQRGASIDSAAGTVTLTLANGLAQDAGSAITAEAGNVLISSAGTLAGDNTVSLAAGGILSAPAGLVQLVAPVGDITQAAPGANEFTGVIDAAFLAVQAGAPSSGAYNVLLGGQNGIQMIVDTVGGTYSGATGSVLLADQGPLTQGASSLFTAGGSVTIQAASLVQLGGATLTGGTGVSVIGDLQQTGQDQVKATQGDVSVTGSATQTLSTVAALGNATIGSLSQTTSSLIAGGAVFIGPAQTPTGTLVLDQHVGSTISAGTDATVYGAATQDMSRLSAIDQAVVYGGLGQTSATLVGSAVTIGRVGLAGKLSQSASSVTAGSGGLTVTLSGDLTQDASSALASVGGAVVLETTGGSMALGGLVSAAAPLGSISLTAQAGSVTQTAPGATSPTGTLLAGTLLAQAGLGDLLLDGVTPANNPTNQIGTIALASATGTLLIVDAETLTEGAQGSIAGDGGVSLRAPDLVQADGGTIASSSGNIFIDATVGDLSFAGLISATGALGQVALLASGAITEEVGANIGTLKTNVLAAQAAGNVSLTGAANQIAAISPVSLPGSLTQAGVSSTAGSVTLNDSLSLALQDASISGARGVGLDVLDLTETATGTIASADGTIAMQSPGTLSFAGMLLASQIVLGDGQTQPPMNAEEPARIVWNGGIVLTGSSIPVGPGEPAPRTPIFASSGAQGLFATAANFSQTGTTSVRPLSGQGTETVELSLKGPGGLIAFDPAANAGLFAPTTQLLLVLQAAGRATGNIDVAGLNIYTAGSSPTGGASLTGLVDGRGGAAAAATGFVHLLQNVNYQDNGCPVQSLNCVLLSPVSVPLGNPVQDFEYGVGGDQSQDDDLILPNVAEQDY